ncbi:hypothetical protein TNCV_4951431 [Trichonephila clavipes]|nr:hypothetical protein TNCV_4951431 [Trichonephila clavipes]
MYLICSLPYHTPSQDMSEIRHPNPVEELDVGSYFNSQYRAIAGRADHQHLFFPSVGVWGKVHSNGWHRSDLLFPLRLH